MIRVSSSLDLEVIGFVGDVEPAEAPMRLLPIYRSRKTPEILLLPPIKESGTGISGQLSSKQQFEQLRDEGELTELESPLDAKSGHLLWMSPNGPVYQAKQDAERELEQLAVKAVEEACAQGLQTETARDLLFGSLRARPTVLANALLVVHFNLADEITMARPIRQDLAAMAGKEMSDLEWRQFAAAKPTLCARREVATAAAAEVRWARQEELAARILDLIPLQFHRAADRVPPMSWAGLSQEWPLAA